MISNIRVSDTDNSSFKKKGLDFDWVRVAVISQNEC